MYELTLPVLHVPGGPLEAMPQRPPGPRRRFDPTIISQYRDRTMILSPMRRLDESLTFFFGKPSGRSLLSPRSTVYTDAPIPL
jgi:hypothetical protein